MTGAVEALKEKARKILGDANEFVVGAAGERWRTDQATLDSMAATMADFAAQELAALARPADPPGAVEALPEYDSPAYAAVQGRITRELDANIDKAADRIMHLEHQLATLAADQARLTQERDDLQLELSEQEVKAADSMEKWVRRTDAAEAKLEAAESRERALRAVPRYGIHTVEKHHRGGHYGEEPWTTCDLKEERHPDGDWVKWDDIHSALASRPAGDKP